MYPTNAPCAPYIPSTFKEIIAQDRYEGYISRPKYKPVCMNSPKRPQQKFIYANIKTAMSDAFQQYDSAKRDRENPSKLPEWISKEEYLLVLRKREVHNALMHKAMFMMMLLNDEICTEKLRTEKERDLMQKQIEESKKTVWERIWGWEKRRTKIRRES